MILTEKHIYTQEEKEDLCRKFLEMIGEDPNREGLLETPKRMVKSWDQIYAGYKQDPKEFVKTFDAAGCDQIVLLKNFEYYSLCEHHNLPFFGHASVAYIPNKRVIGVSKLARIFDCFSKRMQIQERLGEQVTDFLMEELQPQGAACIIKGVHLCTRMRGIMKQDSQMVTSSVKGVFMDRPQARAELMALINMPE